MLSLALLGGFVCTALAQSPPAAARYSIKQDFTGSNVPREVVRGNTLPINLRYEELTPEQQALVRSQYEGMAAGDEPPFPAHGLAPLYKSIHQVQAKLLVRGPLSMFVDVGPDGTANSVSVLQSPDAEFTRAVAAIVMLTRFKPARCDGQPCAMQFPLRVDMKVDL